MDKKIIYTTSSPSQTKKLGFLLGKSVLAGGFGARAAIFFLSGDLGAGKTQFAQGFARALGVRGAVNSPTFVILKRYDLAEEAFKFFFHIDCYRLKSGRELELLGIKEILENPRNIAIIEWPGIAKDILPKNIPTVSFEAIGKNRRLITIEI